MRRMLISGVWMVMGMAALAQYPGQGALPVAAAVKAYSFDLQDVRLLKSRSRDNMEREGRWMLSLPVARLLHSFRVNAGMLTLEKDSKTKMPQPLGGWEALDMELRGHSIGHLLSGLAMQYASTGDARFKVKGDSLIKGLAEVQEALGSSGYLSAFPEHYIDRNISGQAVWAPWYTIHKLVAGLIDQYWYAGNHQALEIVTRMADWAYKKISPLKEEQVAVMLRNEFGGMNEAWYNLYAITRNPRHKALGDIFYHKAVLDPLSRGEDKLAGMHANTVIPKITGEARDYELTGDKKAAAIAQFFWDDVIRNQTYAIGSNSDKEHFIEPGAISKHLSGYTGESCNTYNMLKLTRHLFTWTADVRYADYYEQALYNHILGQQDPSTGMVCYFTPMLSGSYKLYSTWDSSFWCCVGSGFESHSKYGEGIYYHDDKGIFINLFIPSVLTWKEKGFVLRQETAYPEEETTRLIIDSVSATSGVALYVRYPSWATSGAFVKIDGKEQPVAIHQPGYITIERKWKKGDVVEVRYPMSLRMVPAPDDPAVAAIAYGPIVLAGEMGTKGMRKPDHDPRDPYEYYDYDYAVPANLEHTLHIQGRKLSDCLKPDGRPLEFVMDTGIVRLKPYYDIHRERSVVYWNIDQGKELSIYQYSVPVEGRRAFLWIPPACRHVRGVIISFANLTERCWLEDPLIRKTAAEEGLGIIWVGGSSKGAALTADLGPGGAEALRQMMKDLARESGFAELEWAPFIAMGHSANGQLAWRIPAWDAGRTIAAIPIKTAPLPGDLGFTGVPLCYIVGQTTEWPQYRDGRPGDRDFFWPVVRNSALVLRRAAKDNLIGVVTDPGGGHFDWSPRLAAFVALYIHKACQWRLPAVSPQTGPVVLRKIDAGSGWLTGSGGMLPDSFPPAAYYDYKGDVSNAYWFFDKETALAAAAFEGDRRSREIQMLTFIQDGRPLPVAQQGFAPLSFEPGSDGLSFRLETGFLAGMPPELVGAGRPLGHAPGEATMQVITGPAVQTGPSTFRVQFNRQGPGGDIWILASHPGDGRYRHAVQPGKMHIPERLTEGASQVIRWPGIGDQPAGVKTVALNAVASSGLPVDYYVVSGPAIVDGHVLRITDVPERSRWPIKITVTAYQWGRMRAPLYQSAEPVTQEFYLTK